MDITKITAALLNAYTDKKGTVDKEAVKSEAESLGISMLKDEGVEVDGSGYDEALQKFIERVEKKIENEKTTNWDFFDDLMRENLDFKSFSGQNDTLKEAYEELVYIAKDEDLDETSYKFALFRFMNTMRNLQDNSRSFSEIDTNQFYRSLEMDALSEVMRADYITKQSNETTEKDE